MSKNFALIGGDLRIINLAKMLAKDNMNVFVYGMEKAENINDINNLHISKTLEGAISASEIIIGPMPFSSDNIYINTSYSEQKIYITILINAISTKTLIAGRLPDEVKEILNEKNINYFDFMEQEDLTILNALSTAEGAIQIAMNNSERLLHGMNALILGFGRIAKILAQKLKGLSVNVTCAARKKEDFAWMTSYGYKKLNINLLGENLKYYDIIFNTVPHLIITKEKLKYINNNCILIDLASKPGGFDQSANFIWALALPGKVAPLTSAQFMKDTIYNIIGQREEER